MNYAVKLPATLYDLLVDAGIGPPRDATGPKRWPIWGRFLSEAIIEFLPSDSELFGERPNRQGKRDFTVKRLMFDRYELVRDLSKRRQIIKQAHAEGRAPAGQPPIVGGSQNDICEEVLARKIAWEYADRGLEGQEDRVSAVTGYDPRDRDRLHSLRRPSPTTDDPTAPEAIPQAEPGEVLGPKKSAKSQNPG